MSDQPRRGLSREGLDAAFEADESTKSNLILEGELLRAQGRHDEAAAKFAGAAEVEERLSQTCESKGLVEKAWVHRFSAVGCWAQAGNYHRAIVLGEAMLARTDLPERLRQAVGDYTERLRARRARIFAEVASQHALPNGGSTPTVERDERTGQTYLRVPLAGPELAEPALRAVGAALENLGK
jgi:hypothetical protein